MRSLLPRVRLGLPVLLVSAVCLLVRADAHPGINEQITALDERIAATPTDATLYLRRGELYRIHRDWAQAESD
ncbi:MAG: hypothetical protein IH848_09905, partial [Acidobacteria bacterium]|nr:hypothetical protein [Acidobacteriota bacterium]